MSELTAFNIKPAQEGGIVRDPVTGKPLNGRGENKPRNSYWLRRLNDGDVVEAEPVRETASKAPTATPDHEHGDELA